jgi:hypothetical protein
MAALVPTMYHIATEELGIVYARVQPKKFVLMVSSDCVPVLVNDTRGLVPSVTGARTLGAPKAIDFSISDGPPASHNVNYVRCWRQILVAAQQKSIG